MTSTRGGGGGREGGREGALPYKKVEVLMGNFEKNPLQILVSPVLELSFLPVTYRGWRKKSPG